MSGPRYLGIDAGGTAIKYVLTDGQGELSGQGSVPTDPLGAHATLDEVAAAVQIQDLAGVGLACAGIVDPVSGRLGRSPNLPGWQGANLADALKDAFGPMPVALANDVNGALYGEYRRGAGRNCRNLIMIALGTGVGGGVLIEGRLVLGSHFGAAEIGHMVLDPDGPECTCGNAGCLEAWAGSVGILRRTRQWVDRGEAGPELSKLVLARGSQLNPRDLAQLAEAGDPDATGILAEVGRKLGQAVGSLINLLDPERVIIGGGVAQAGDLILGPCRETFPALVLAEEARSTPVVPAELGNLAAAVGAANLALEQDRNG